MAVVQREDGGGEGTPPTNGSDDIRRLEREVARLSGRLDSANEHREDQMRFLERQIASNAEQIAKLGEYLRETAGRSERNERQINELSVLVRETAMMVRTHDTKLDNYEQIMAGIRENTRAVSELSQKSEIRIDNHDQVMAEIRENLRSATEIVHRSEHRIDNRDEIMEEVRDNLRAVSEAGQLTDERSRRAFELSERNDRQIEKLGDYIATVAKKLDRLDTSIKIGTAVIAFVITTGAAVAAIVFG